MRAILVRIGIDQEYGGWNAPVDVHSGEFVYVPIPDPENKRYRIGCKRIYREIFPALERFRQKFGIRELAIPNRLLRKAMHLDPDFEKLTYGDRSRRGKTLKQLSKGDLLVFYAGLRPANQIGRLIYSIVGLFTVEKVSSAEDIIPRRRHENAHTRWSVIDPGDIVVKASSKQSGRLTRSVRIGEWRDGAYRVKRGILTAWGGLTVRDGYIQRSRALPKFCLAPKFLRWFSKHRPKLVRRNN